MSKKPAVPAAVTTFVAGHDKKKVLHYGKPVPMFEGDLEIRIDPAAAKRALDGEEAGYDPARHVPLGLLWELPLVVEAAKATLPVKVLMEGRLVPVAASLAAFGKALAPPPKAAPGPKKGAALLEPPTVARAPEPVPAGAWFIPVRTAGGGPFLWIDIPKANKDLYYSSIYREQTSVAKAWKSTTSKLDRGTGDFLDVAWLDKVPCVTPRARAILEQLPLAGVEFLPLRVDVKGTKGDYFVMHPTRKIDCLDRAKCEFPDAERDRTWGPAPERLVIKDKAVPADAHAFRPDGYASVIVWSRALATAVAAAKLCGVAFKPVSAWVRSD